MLTATKLENHCTELGYSRSQAKRIARFTMNRDDIDLIQAAFADPSMLTYVDPVGDEATDRVLFDILTRQAA